MDNPSHCPISDLSLSGYEFYDNVVPGMRQDGQQEINNGNRSETATSKGPEEEKPADLIIVDKIIGEGPPVEKTSIVHFLYMILKTDGTEVGGSGGKGVPVCSAPTKALQKFNTHSGNAPYGRHSEYHAR